MSDDIIRVRLQLDEQSVAQMKNRINNVLKTINNQSLRVTVNTDNLSSMHNQLNRIKQRIDEINKSTITLNSNAGLTQAQQQYRLETQRLAVQQRLQLARERTTQSENNAIRALAEENRLLTANLSLNQRISGEIQHTHTRVRDTTKQVGVMARFFERAFEGLIAYRAVSMLLSSISQAYTELKNVDTELVNIRKVTEMTADEMDRLAKSAYEVAQAYGRAASAYLTAVAEFSKAGYDEKAQELGKLSLLTQNVGELEAELANKFLISADAAWKYNGDITKLMAILDGFNELSNKTATNVSALAEGITIAGSMFSQAGLSAEEYSALVGTVQADTQQTGKVVARGLRTILMNIRQIRGTDVETGEVIDSEALAKAEKALNAVGISIREIRNGTNQLKDPMNVLTELANKWEGLSDIQQSALQESLAGKHQANILTSLLENWKDVEGAMEIYANSTGSAMRENEYYMDSWNSKLEVMQAKWNGYIANLQDIDTIKGGLDAISAIITVLDTDIGRFITQMIVLYGALTLVGKGFAWVQTLKTFQKLNLAFEIAKITAANYGLAAASKVVATTLWQTAAAWAATPMGMATIAIAGIMLLVKAFKDVNAEFEEQKQKAQSLKSEHDELLSKLEELENQLEENNKKIDEINSNPLDIIDKNTLSTLKDENKELQRQIQLTKDLEQAKKKASGEQAEIVLNNPTEKSSRQNVQDEHPSLLPLIGDSSTYGIPDMEQYEQVEEKYGNLMNRMIKVGTNHISLPDKAKEQIQILNELYDKLNDDTLSVSEINSISSQIADETAVLAETISTMKQYKEQLDLTDQSQKNLYDTITQLEDKYVVLNAKMNANDTFDEIWDNEIVSKQKEQLIDLAQTGELMVDTFKETFPVIAMMFEEIGLSVEDVIGKVIELSNSPVSLDVDTDLTDFNEQIDSIQSAYDTLKSARDEYNKYGAYSLDTVQKLLQLEPQYLALLVDENGQMVINEEKLKDIIKLQIEEAKAKIYQAGINQLNALMEAETAGATDDMAESKSGAVDDINSETEAINSNTKALAFNQAVVDAQNMGISNEKIQAILDNTENFIKGLDSVVNGLDLDFGGTVSGFDDTKESIDNVNESIKDTLKSIDDLNKEQALADLQKTIDDVTNSLSLMAQTLERLNTLQDLTFEKDYTTKFQTVSQQFMEATKYGGQMRLELERLLAITPQTADEAEALASRLESLSSDFFENEKAIIEYRNGMYETAIEFIGESTENLSKQTSRAKEIFDHSISLSETGSISGRGFWSRTLLPSVSKDKVKQQRAENKKLIKEEEDYQKAIAKIRQQATDMAKKEADEDRAEQLADYQKQLEEYKKQLAEYESSINNYKNTTVAATQANNDLMNSNANVAGSFDGVAASAENATTKIEGFIVKKSEYDKAVAEMGKAQPPYAPKMPTNEYGQVPWIVPDKANTEDIQGVYADEGKSKTVSMSVDKNDIVISSRFWGVEYARINKDKFYSLSGVQKNQPLPASMGVIYPDGSMSFVSATNANMKYRIPAGSLNYNDKVSFKAEGGTTSGLTITGEGTGELAGQEAYIGRDGKLHLFENGVRLSDLPPNTRVINAQDLREIIKYTGNKYFNEPIDNLDSVTVNKYAKGNTDLSVNSLSIGNSNTANDFETYLNQSFDNLKDRISFDNVKQALYGNLTDDKFYKELADSVADKTGKALDEADSITSKDVKNTALKNASWDNIPDQLQEKFSELGANSENWSSWINDDKNSLQAFNLMEGSGESSWDFLDENIQTLLYDYGIHGKEEWDTFVEENPMQALQLLTSSWEAMNQTISQYINDAIAIAVNGANAIHAIEIVAPQISQASWDNLQTLIANKIQEILNVISETFGANTIDLNFSVGLTGNEQTNPQGVGTATGDGSSPTGNALVDTAKQFLGTDYVWGGDEPKDGGFDCSGLMQYVFKLNGKSIPRTTYEQIKSGIAVDKSSLVLGDLVFFGDSSAPHHVGMYVGDGKYLHAPRTGDVVKISDLSSRSDYAGARRYASGTQGATAGKAIVGEEYWLTGANHPTPELIIKKSTGKAYLAGLNGAEVVNLGSGDTVVPYSQTNEILNGNTSFNTYARGTGYVRTDREDDDKNDDNELKTVSDNKVVKSWEVPDGLGKSHSYTAFNEDGYLGSKLGYWNTSSGAWKVFSSLLATGELTTDQNGIYMYKGARLVAMTSTFGKAGDVMRFTQDDGTVFYGIIMDEKSQVHTWYDDNPANMWGHNGGKDIVEFEVKKSDIAPAYRAAGGTPPYGNLNHYITMIENLGSLYGFDFSDIPANGDTLSSKIQEFFSKLKSITGTYKTTTNTGKSTVAAKRSLGSTRQSNYGFDVPFTRREHGGMANANTIVQTNEHHKQEATIDENGNIVPIGDGSPQVLVSDHDFPVINAHDYAKIKKYGGDKKPVKFLEKGNVDVSTTTETINEEDTEKKKKDEEERNSILKNLEEKVSEIPEEIKNLSLEELKGISFIVDAIDEDTDITADMLMEYKDIGVALQEYDKWAENNLDDLLNSYTESYYKQYNEEQKKYLDWQSGFREELREFSKGATEGDYMSRWYALIDKGSAKARETVITQQGMQVNSTKEVLSKLNEERDMLLNLFVDAPAEVQSIIIERLEELDGVIDDVDSEYADSMQTLTDYMIEDIEQQKMRNDSVISYLQYDRDLLSEELSRATDPTQISDLYDEIDKNLDEEIAWQNKIKEQSHQNVVDLRENANETEQFLFDNYKFDEMFDANGEFNDVYYKALDTLQHDYPEYVEIFKYLANIIQENKKNWQGADEAARQAGLEKQDNAIAEANAKIELEVDLYDKINDRLDLRYNKEQAVINALEAQYSLQQSLRDEALEYEAQLKANKHLEEYLDPQAKALLFNDDDYSEMIAEIEDIGAEAQTLYEKYQARISTLGEQDYYQEQLITEEYNQQIEALNERLATKKQELEVSKKQLEYENTLKERDTRVILGGRSIQIADPDKLYNIEMERSKAEQQLENLVQDNLENQTIRDMQLASAETQEMIAANEQYVKTLQGLDDNEKVRHAEQMASTEELTAAIHVLSQDEIGWLNRYEYTFREQMGSFTDVEWGNGFDYNNDYSSEQEIIKMLRDSGAITEEFYNTLMRANESKRNDKIANDPINAVYAPQTQNYGGQLAEPYYGVNGDRLVDEYNEIQSVVDDINNDNNQNSANLAYQMVNLTDRIIEQTDEFVGSITSLKDVIASVSKETNSVEVKKEDDKYTIYNPNGHTYKLGNTVVSGEGSVIVGSSKAYATGTKSAKSGMALVDEEAYELKLRELQSGKFVPLEQGDMIFDADATERLWDFANSPKNFLQEQMGKMNNLTSQIQNIQNTNMKNVENNFAFSGDIVVTETINNADELFGNVISQASSRYDVTKNMR